MAVLEKIKPITPKEAISINSTQSEDVTSSESTSASGNVNKRELENSSPAGYRKKPRFEGYREDPFVFFKDDEPLWADIKSFYHISDEFDAKCLLTRCEGGKKKNIYFASPAVRDLVLHNKPNVKFINTGIRSFVRSDNRNMKCAFR